MRNQFGGRLSLQSYIQAALSEDGQTKLAEAGRHTPARGVPEGPPVWLHDPDEVEKLATALEVVGASLGNIVDDRSPMERLSETSAIRGAFSKVAEGPQPPMRVPDDTSTFPSTLGVGVPTDLNSPPGGAGPQPYKKDSALPKFVPSMTIGVQKKVLQPNMGEAIPTDEQSADAPGGSAANPLYGGPAGGARQVTGMKTGSAKGRYIRALMKTAQDPSSPQPVIAGKVSGDRQSPALNYSASASEEGVPWGDVGNDPSNKQRSAIQGNAAPVAAKPRDLSVVAQRPEMKKLLTEPMQSAAHDSKLKENLSKIEEAAGPKLASAQPTFGMAKSAAARALLKKLAAAGAETGQGPENKTGTSEDEEKDQQSREEKARMLAQKAGKKAKNGDQEKRSMGMGALPSPGPMASSSAPMMAGPGIASV